MTTPPVASIAGKAVPLSRDNVDTDALCPAAPMKALGLVRDGLGQILFHELRLAPDGTLRPDFALNEPRYAGASILVAGQNFGCGSSREHAVWALVDHGFRAVLALSFADIFENNAYKNGLLPARIEPDLHGRLLASPDALTLAVDLQARTVRLDTGELLGSFTCDVFGLRLIMEQTDELGLTAAFEGLLTEGRDRLLLAQPWLV